MLSTEKTLSLDAMDKYWRRVEPYIAADTEFVASQKIDGLSINLTYVNGVYVQATTSGNGLVGSDKTARVQLIPDVLKTLPVPWSGQISGECFMTDSNFTKLNDLLTLEGSENQKTSRNSTAGLINAGTIKNEVQKLALLSFKVWGVYEKDNADIFGSYSKYTDQLEKARSLGFTPVDYHLFTKSTFDGNKDLEYITGLEYENDGVVYRLNDQEKARQLGVMDDYLNAVTALKPVPAGAITTVTAITWMQGTQELSPIVWYEPVNLGGAICQKVAGHSVKNLIDCGAFPGNKVFITRSGGVIPKLNHVSKASNFS
jgi:DNA ligase (NAD+)